MVRGVAPWDMEAGLAINILSIGDDGPILDVGEEQVDCFLVVADVLLPPLLDVLHVNNLFDGGDSASVNGLLEIIFLPAGLLILLEFEEVATVFIVND